MATKTTKKTPAKKTSAKPTAKPVSKKPATGGSKAPAKPAAAPAAPAATSGSGKKGKYESVRSPAGEMKYGWVIKPNVKHDKDGVYSVDLRLPNDEAAKFKAFLQKKAEAQLAAFQKENPAKYKKYKLHVPFLADTDENGDETDSTIFRFKQKAKVRWLDNKTGEERTRFTTIDLFDAKGNKVDASKVKLGRGSIVKVAAVILPCQIPSDAKAGIRLGLNAVQIIELKEWDSSRDASSYGFEKEEGFEAEEEDSDSPFEDGDEGEEDAEGEESEDTGSDDDDATSF